MNAQTAFSLVAVFYSVANLGSMDLELNLREAIMILLAVPVPLVVWLGVSSVLGSRAGKAGVEA